MKPVVCGRRLAAWLCVVAVAAGSARAAGFPDEEGHWAAAALDRAVACGMLTGDSAGRLTPDDPVTGGEAVTMLCRVLSARAEGTAPGSEGQWFETAAGRAQVLGILPEGLDLSRPLTRGEAFCLLANSFQLAPEGNDTQFPELADALPAVRRAALALEALGVLRGTGDGLQLESTLTRAELVTLLDRLAVGTPNAAVTMLRDREFAVADTTYQGAVLLAPPVAAAAFSDVVFEDDCIVRGDRMESLHFEHVRGSRLTLAATASPLTLTGEAETVFQTVVIGDGGGETTLSGGLTKAVQIMGAGRAVSLSGMALDSLVIAGADCTVTVGADTQIESVSVLPGADGARLLVEGALGEVSLRGADAELSGAGSARRVTARGKRCSVSLDAAELDIEEDLGLTGMTLLLDAPPVPPGGALTASARIEGGDTPKSCRVTWSVDGAPVSISDALLSDGVALPFSVPLEFTYEMPEARTVVCEARYENPITGETETLRAETTAAVQNYPVAHYAEAIIARITPQYAGPAPDYTAEEKTVFVNAKGYESPTNYLLWVSLSRQKVNVFEGAQGAWSLTHSFDCATGTAETPTPIGVTYVTRKQSAWKFSAYQCRPIVRFYPNTGYAFHSRLYTPDGAGLVDGTMGTPASHGCIRMMDDGIYWIFDNVPLRTTVVIY